MTETVQYDKRDRLAFVTLNRPAARNAIDPETHEELCRVWRDFRDDDGVDVAILTGSGDAFCAGADLKPSCRRTTWTPRRAASARSRTSASAV